MHYTKNDSHGYIFSIVCTHLMTNNIDNGKFNTKITQKNTLYCE